MISNNLYNQHLYAHPSFDKYIYDKSKQYASAPLYAKTDTAPSPSFSLDEILLQDSNRLLDQVVNTAFNITYRIRIYRDINASLESKWNELSSELGALSGFRLGYNMNVERRKSMLEKERNAIEKQQLEHKLQTWDDLNSPIRYLIQDFHKHREFLSDQKTLRD